MQAFSLLITMAMAFAFCIGFSGQIVAQNSQIINNSIGMKLVLIPRGTFMMGSPIKEMGRGKNEQQHQVKIGRDFYLGAYEVTQGQYEKVMRANPSFFQEKNIRKSDTLMYPVEQISWNDAVEFCKRLSELPEEKDAGRVYRLPTEAEWEYACRAGSKTAFCYGDDPKSLGDHAWFDENSDNQTHPVGKKKPNIWGLFDMHGNVWEYCSDWIADYPKDAVTDPLGPLQGLGSFRACRGGGFPAGAMRCRSADRSGIGTTDRFRTNGLRVALGPSGSPG